jgi:hypothetical protein
MAETLAAFDRDAMRRLAGSDAAATRARIELLERVLERAFIIAYLVWEARNLGLPRWQIARMMANVGIDTAIGAIPLAGDVFDFLFRSGSKNLRIIKRHLDKHHPATVLVDAGR